MGLIRGNLSFTRFSVEGRLPQAFLIFINNRIKSNSFQESSKSTEEKRSGWVSITDVLDADFENANYALGDYLIFSLRIDRKVVPPKLLKIKIMEAQRSYLAQTGKSRLNKQTTTEIKDKVKLELLTRLDPVPSFYDVCWALGQNIVYFSSLADKVADDFVDLFKKTFALNLIRLLPQDNSQILKKIAEAAVSREEASLLGREFMTWLWFKSEERNGKITLPKGEEVDLSLLKKIVLESGDGEYAQGVVCHGMHAELKEGKEAIRQGKKVKEAGIKLTADQNEWEFTFKADNFHFQSLKLPAREFVEDDDDPSGKLLERIYLMEKAAVTMDMLFDFFLTVRFSAQWQGRETGLLTKWLKYNG